MEKYLPNLHKALNSGDPEAKTWFLVRHDYLPFILVGFYLLVSCYLGPALMKNRKPFDLRVPMVIFNFVVVLVYVITTFNYFRYIVKVPFENFCKRGAVVKGTPEYIAISNLWVVYILKYIEFLDTAFFILRKKQNLVTPLHVTHHTVVPLLGWVAFRTEQNGVMTFPVILNSIVHIIMYTYYGLAAMGPQMRQYLWWKKYITQLQMIQFLLIIVSVMMIAPLMGCPLVISSYLMGTVVPGFFLYLFHQFYKAAFHPVVNGTAKMEKSTNGHAVNGTTYKASEKDE